ncbi:DNA-directed RNA polymerase III subunit RPC4 [Patella vulgata]|uniref:DNA-directed RNA polymerase III subunit RPC4 n=1 Tax=Patella vulgata TaxID=6465 RepID=UPI00217F6B10|nr:DNA-directed RNA polymerase III subunit RPC4 [Patella vulgata]XP_050391935.1 DNA-directed RNA polymerase III subunit RPC4 [Patella vulgata]XP_050391936.1 DNA-directed RNA polymerase III subunit RPC4 [Patella vulgata]
MADNNKPDLPKGLIGRKGATPGKAARLPSLKGPRDLTLGGVPKKVFTPNIPARRDKPKEEATTNKQVKQQAGHSRNRSNERGRGRGRGRTRENTLVQSHSIFEQGPAQKLPGHRASSSRNDGDRASSSKMSVKREKKEPGAVKKILDDLLRDDFIDDGTKEDEDMAPVVLPLASKIKSEIKTEIQTDIKTEPIDQDEDSKDIEMVDVEKNKGSAINSNKVKKVQETVTDDISCEDFFTKCGKTENGELIFLQLPDTLPGLPPAREEESSKPSKVKAEDAKDPGKKEEDGLLNKLSTCCLSDFSEGYIGKIQIRKSGKAELLLGNVKLDVAIGTPSGFLQDVVSVKVADETGHMAVLGQVKQRLICTPNFESLLDCT